jgi:hypothetical protein
MEKTIIPFFASDALLLIFFSVSMPRFLNDFPEQKPYDSIYRRQWISSRPSGCESTVAGRSVPLEDESLKIIRQQDNAEKAFILVLA